jgi:hypothetical protein
MTSIATIIEGGEDNTFQYEIFTGQRFDSFIKDLPEMSDEEINNISNSTIEILRNCAPPVYNDDMPVSNTGLVFGYVQSGKTMSFTGLIALASDNNYKLIIVLAGTTRILLEQTTNRLKKDLSDRNSFEIVSEENKLYSRPDLIAEIINNPERNRTVILTILKHHKHIKDVKKILSYQEIKSSLLNKSVLIIDDEADQASLNGLARKNWSLKKKNKISEEEKKEFEEIQEFTTTYNNILELKNELDCHSYIQYTATPQANILAAQRDLLKPSWSVVLEPGSKYTGGKVFFHEDSELIINIKSENEDEDPEMPDELQDAFLLFLIESAILTYDNYPSVNRLKKIMKRTSMMVHADRLIERNSVYKRWLEAYCNSIRNGIKSDEDETNKLLMDYYPKVQKMLSTYFNVFPNFEDVKKVIQFYVLDEIRFWFVAGNGDSLVDWESGNHHVLIGGQKLDRGFTVNELITTYLPRQTKSISNADTIEQRCRFFGYKKDYIEACRVFLPQQSINEFQEYVAHEEKLRGVLKNGNIMDYYDNDVLMRIVGLNPTSLNKIPGELIRTDFYNYKFLEPDFENNTSTSQIINSLLEKCEYKGELSYSKGNKISDDNCHKVSITNVQNLLLHLKNLKVNRKKDNLILNQFTALLDDIDQFEKVWVIEMAYKRDGFRPRSLNEKGELMALFTNHPPEFGDTKLLMTEISGGIFHKEYSNEIIIQIHKIKIKPLKNLNSKYKEHEGKVLDIIAFRYPNKNSSNYIQINYD